MANYGTSPGTVMEPQDIFARADELEAEQRAFMEEVRKARAPGFSQPQQLIQSYQPRAKGQVGPWNGPNGFGQFLKSVRTCTNGQFGSDPLMKQWATQSGPQWATKALPAGMNETVGADGGYLVPPEFAQQLLMRIYANDLLSRTVQFPLTTSNTIKIPAVNESSRADGSRFGGVQAFWRSEAATVSRTKPSVMQVSLEVNSLTCTVEVTNELLEDASAIPLQTFVNLVVPQELQFKIGDGIVNGDGITKPIGLMNSPSKITQNKESGQSTGTIVSANILNMWSRLHLSCWPNAVWLADVSTLPQLQQMTIGTAGAQLVVWLPQGGLSSAPFGTIMGRPLLITEFNKTLSTEGDIILTDLSTYLTATKGGLQTASSIHVLFESNELLYRFIIRIDGKPWWLTSLTPKSGGSTQSNIVTLQSR